MEPDERECRRMQRILKVLVVLLIPGGLVAAGVDTLLKTGVLFSWYATLMFGAIVWFIIRPNVAYLRWDKRRPFWWPWR